MYFYLHLYFKPAEICICICISSRRSSSSGWGGEILETLCNDSSANALNHQLHSAMQCNVLKCNPMFIIVARANSLAQSRTTHAVEECSQGWVWKFSGRCILCYITQVSTFSAQLGCRKTSQTFSHFYPSNFLPVQMYPLGGNLWRQVILMFSLLWDALNFCKLKSSLQGKSWNGQRQRQANVHFFSIIFRPTWGGGKGGS